MQEFMLAAGEGGTGSMMMMILPMIAIFYFLLIRPQKKREKAAKEMRDSLEVGDEILTVGGILGRVVSLREDSDSILIESGSANTKLRIAKSAIQTNITGQEKVRERQAAQAQSAAEERERKKGGKGKDVDAMKAAEDREKELQKKMDN